MTNLATKLNRMINWVGGKVLKCSPPASLRIQVAVGLGGAIQIRVTSPSTSASVCNLSRRQRC